MFTIEVLLEEEIDSLLQLQKANLKSNITAEERASQGFLTFPYTKQELKQMLDEMPQPVIKKENSIEAYALACTKEVCLAHSLLSPMVHLSNGLQWKGKSLAEQNYYIMGQICVGSSLRGTGAFDALYEKHKELFAKEYDCIVTEIAVNNLRSMSAHQRVGFRPIHQYSDGETKWNVVVWDWIK